MGNDCEIVFTEFQHVNSKSISEIRKGVMKTVLLTEAFSSWKEHKN